jgi:hypothetical protein
LETPYLRLFLYVYGQVPEDIPWMARRGWRVFFSLLELKREGRLPPFITWVSPPGCRKRKRNSRTLWTVLRIDKYRMYGDRNYPHGPRRGWLDRSWI